MTVKSIFTFIKITLDKFGIGMDDIVSQSYDGASVMSGEHNGLKKLIRRMLAVCSLCALIPS